MNLLVDKALTLRGIDRPTLDGGLHGDVIRVRAADVTIDGMIVRDSGGDLEKQNAGIYIEPRADRAKVLNCDLTYNLWGIWIETVKDVEIRDNLITGKRDFISPRRGNGIQLYNTEGRRSSATRSASCATASTWMCPIMRCFATTVSTTCATAPTT